jgi:hypothetical protein
MRLLIIFSFLFFSCSNNRSVPADVLSKKEMQAVLWDMMRADEMVNYYTNTDSSYKNLHRNLELYQKVFQLHGTTKDEFRRSMDFYQKHPDILQPVLDSLKTFAERKSVAPVTAQ